MRKGLLFFAALAMLSACNPGNSTNDPPQPSPRPRPPEQPLPWLTEEPVCTGAITRAEWLICDNSMLNDLHRRLARQWSSARSDPTWEQRGVLRRQLFALLAERDACQDVTCVATAYNRYLDAPPPPPPPIYTPKPKPRPKWHPRHGHWRDRQDWEPRGTEQSCAAAIGPAAAAHLSHQCDAVTSGPRGMCSVRRSCDSLQTQIEHGCRESYRKPPFCRP